MRAGSALRVCECVAFEVQFRLSQVLSAAACEPKIAARASGERVGFGFSVALDRVRAVCGGSAMRVCGCVALLLLAGSSRAYAFADLFRFNDAAAVGGGGGRWFTGSPAEGFGCDVCHDGSRSEQIVVQGLPASYVLGASYEMSVSWPATSAHVTALVELTDELGRGAGVVSIGDSPLTVAESCVPVEDGTPAALVFADADLGLANGRQLVGMQDCGGTQLHWRWTAPAVDVGTILFVGGLVEPDQQKNAEGDRVAKFMHPIASESVAQRRAELTGNCAVAAIGGYGSSAACFVTVVGAMGAVCLRLRRRVRC